MSMYVMVRWRGRLIVLVALVKSQCTEQRLDAMSLTKHAPDFYFILFVFFYFLFFCYNTAAANTQSNVFVVSLDKV